MNRSCISALISLACLSTLSALAQSSGSAEPFVTLSVGANPTAGGVSLTGTVQPDIAGNTRHPSGSVTFLDGTTVLNANGAALAANTAVRSQSFADVFGMPDAGLASTATAELKGDFDGDGKDDLLVCESSAASISMEVQIFLTSNSGEGNFRALAPQTLATPTFNDLTPTILDVDGDGKLDLLVGNTVAYGSGDGTFSRTAVLPILATGFSQTYAVDVNGDAKLDIVAVNTPPQPSFSGPAVQYMFTVFLNKGNGTFTSLGSFPLAPPVQPGQGLCCAMYIIFGLNFADINGDGKLDVLSQSAWVPGGDAAAVNHLNVMLNNGDGTFGAGKAVDVSALGSLSSEAIAFGDLDGDGKQDLVVAYPDYRGQNYLAAALGNGDGTFRAFSPLLLINYLTIGTNPQVQLMDFDGDGRLDAIVGSGEVALGKGDGTFAFSTPLFAQPANPQIPLSYPLLQMAIYAHSLPSLVYLNLTSGANAVFTPQDSSSANASVALGAGMHTLTAHYSGDSTYAAGDSAPVAITVAPATSTTTVTSSANPSYTGQNVTFTATIAGFASNALTGTSSVTFSDGTTTLGTSPESGGLATITTSFSTAGSHTITAAYSGDANNAASSGTVMQTVDAPVTVGGGGSGGSTSLTVASGQSVTTEVAVSGNAGFSGTVNLSCTGLPVHASCSFSPDSVTVSDKTASAAMTISTSATTTAKSQVGEAARAVTVLACGLPLLGLIMLIPVARGRRLLLCASFLLFVSAAGLTGCGGSSSSDKTAAGSYTFQVVATAGAASSTANYTLKVQ